MPLQAILANRRARIAMIAGGGLLILSLIFTFLLGSCEKPKPTADELRLQHAEWLVQLLESYKQRFGAYPQPTARAETPEGIRHVWGYRPEKPSLASCTVPLDSTRDRPLDSARAPISEDAACGGGVYDIDGNLVGWKGTLTLESGLNTVEIAERKSGRVQSPLSELVQSIPTDPAYDASMTPFGFGEYVYAVRNPEAPGADKRQEYQIAFTVRDPATGSAVTLIRGNYFVRADERDAWPASLIGPGLLFDVYGNAIAGQERPLQVLLEGQREGLPNPVFGNGEQTITILRTRRRAERLLQAIEERIVFLTRLIGSDAVQAVQTLTAVRDRTRALLQTLGDSPSYDILSLQSDLTESVSAVQSGMDAFLAARRDTVKQVLTQETESQAELLAALRTMFDSAKGAEDAVLAARDEILNYLDGEGIEEQTRSRVSRKLQGIMDDLPDISDLFATRRFTLSPFLTESEQSELSALASREGVSGTASGATLTGETSRIFAVTILSELSVHISDLRNIVTGILDDLGNAAKLSDIDGSLQSLSQALRKEDERIANLFDDITDMDAAKEVLARFQKEQSGDAGRAIAYAAVSMKLSGDFNPLLFQPKLLDRVLLDRSPGVPDLDMAKDPLRAEYTGIPYPLP